jgi:hypothetical protein
MLKNFTDKSRESEIPKRNKKLTVYIMDVKSMIQISALNHVISSQLEGRQHIIKWLKQIR